MLPSLTPLRLADRFDRFFDAQVRSRYFRNLDFAGPQGDPGWFGPDSATWYVHSHLPTLTFGLLCAAYIEGLDPSIQAMTADHSRLAIKTEGGYSIDPDGAAVRFGRSLSFFTGTAYGSTETAERLTRTVRAMHHTVKGTRPDGLAYDAGNPEWLRWNYATVVWGLATAHEKYHARPLRGAELDRYYGEFVRVGHALGGTELPTTKTETLDCLKSYLPKLAVTPNKAASTGPNLSRKLSDRLHNYPFTDPFTDWAIRDTLPRWAASMVMHQRLTPLATRARRRLIRLTLNGLHTATGPLEEFRQAQARVAAGTTSAHTLPGHEPGSDPGRSREDIELDA
ncbi:oxygenase MpaB family protein [Streptomyces sp. NPDC051546]|uniref:oxygenase MpaB family protein n=1 Tax=Streptomyces sp. NPDC051546 TaxID=3365655 RepID=UPI0037AB4835